MSKQLYYIEEKIQDISSDFVELVNTEYKELNNNKKLTVEEVVNSIKGRNHKMCQVPLGVPLFEIASIHGDEIEELSIECMCCNKSLYSLKK